MSFVKVDNLRHLYGGVCTVDNVSLQLQKGQIGCLMGASGSGKTTVLYCIAGLEKIARGKIVVDGRTLSDEKNHLPPEVRRIGMVFQDFALFPHLTVADNIHFGAKKKNAQKTTGDIIELCDLQKMRDSYPNELSGGEQQRVALARALVGKPDLLLLDEPFSRLDVDLHERLTRQVRDILKAVHLTALMVTHNQYEAFVFADVGGVINGGEVCQWDDIYNLYRRPQCAFVAQFVGEGALLRGRVLQDGVQTELGILRGRIIGGGLLLRAGDAVHVLLRPDDIVLSAAGGHKATVQDRAFRGATTRYLLKLQNGESVCAICPSHFNFAVGDEVNVGTQVTDLVLFPTL